MQKPEWDKTPEGQAITEHYAFQSSHLNPNSRIAKYIAANKIPYNPLHDRGYRSIGCWPCTRAVGQAGDERAGRWTGSKVSFCRKRTTRRWSRRRPRPLNGWRI